jgi:hypothetical protein
MQGDRVLGCAPWLADSLVPPKGRTKSSRSPFQGGRQRSGATMQGDRVLGCAPWLADSLVPPKGRTKPSRSPFQGGRQRSGATMQGDRVVVRPRLAALARPP